MRPALQARREVPGTSARLWGRAAVSLLLIAWLLRRIDWTEISAVSLRARPEFLALAAVLLLVERGVSVWKWWLLLRAGRRPIGYARLFAVNYAGNFIGMFLPSSVSTDIARGVFLTRVSADAPGAAASVLVDRLSGLLALLIVTLPAVYLAGDLPGIPMAALRVWIGALLAAIVAAACLLPVFKGIPRALRAWSRRLSGGGRLAERAGLWLRACLTYRHFPGTVAAGLTLSALVQALRVMTFHVLARAFVESPPPLVSFFVFVPVILLAIMLPISISGIGVRENAFVALFGVSGLMIEADAFVVSFGMTLLVALTTLPGAFFFFRLTARRRT